MKDLVSLTSGLFLPPKILAPPEAKLTPIRNETLLFSLDLSTGERYGGEVGNPNFSAATQCSIHFTKKFTLKQTNKQTNTTYYLPRKSAAFMPLVNLPFAFWLGRSMP